MCLLAAENNKICAITGAMPGGTGLLDFKKSFPQRLFDVGIAEEHAVSMAGGLAKQGMIPVVAIYSTFLQRAYDMILQDICMQKLHVIFAIDRAGLVGDDGETHHGVFDVGFLRQAPGLTILAPANCAELRAMLRWAVLEQNGPVAIRYPRGGDGDFSICAWDSDAAVVSHRHAGDCAIITYGTMVNNAIAAADILKDSGVRVGVVRLTNIEPLPVAALEAVLSGYKCAVIVEETCDGSGLYEAIAWNLPMCRFTHVDLGKRFTTHGNVDVLYKENGLDAASIAAHIQEVLTHEN
jgi:1-deoxy-D-xylulose-5-phosphate synthase